MAVRVVSPTEIRQVGLAVGVWCGSQYRSGGPELRYYSVRLCAVHVSCVEIRVLQRTSQASENAVTTSRANCICTYNQRNLAPDQ